MGSPIATLDAEVLDGEIYVKQFGGIYVKMPAYQPNCDSVSTEVFTLVNIINVLV